VTVFLLFAPAVLAAFLAYALTPVARRLAVSAGAVDQPAPRKIHSVPTPLFGGLAVMLAAATPLIAVALIDIPNTRRLSPDVLLAIAAGLFPIAAISIWDDLRGQRAIVKFAAHLAGATIAVGAGIRLNPSIHFVGYELSIGWLAIPISILWLAGVTSAFNLIDGLDGLSAGLALISSASLAAVSIVTHHYGMAGAAGILAGALLGFLPYNLFPAKIYLGDTGATFIGFVLGALTLSGGSTTSAGLAVMLPIVVFGVPLADTTLSMVRRSINRIAGTRGGVFDADRNHIHHRLLALGFNHTRAVLLLYGIGLLLSGFAFASLFMTQKNSALLLFALAIAAVVGVSKLGYDEFAVVRKGTVLKVYDTPVLHKSLFVVFVDLFMIGIALYLAMGLKYDDWTLRTQRQMLLGILPLLSVFTLGMFAALRIYRRTWSNANIDDMAKLSIAIITGGLASYVVASVTMPAVPTLTFTITYTLVMLAVAIGARASYRLLMHWYRQSKRGGEPVIIYGAGVGGTLALREILTNTDVLMQPIGFLDDDPQMKGRVINGYPVLGTLQELEMLVIDGKARGIVIASEKIPIAKVRTAQETCESHGAWTKIFTVNFRRLEDDPNAA
jgi:UDP-GlcNAc:undecaprenyl-phosphate/decaprenyl-phosphate GlcNAc-1-phosphate transferase